MAQRDSFAGIARETVYGTFVSPSRSYEIENDDAKRDQSYLSRQGLRAGRQADRVAERRTFGIGGMANPTITPCQTGLGLWLKAMFDTNVAPAQQAAGTAYLQTYTTAQEFNGESVTYQVVRGKPSGVQAFSFPGTVVTGFEIVQDLDKYLKLNLKLDSQDARTADSAATATYPALDVEYGWPDMALTIGGVAVPARKFKFSADRGLDTKRYRLQASALKQAPTRVADPAYGLDIELDWIDDTYYDLFVAGTTQAVVATWTGPIISTIYPYQISLTLPAVQWIGDSPHVDPSGATPTQPLKGMVLYNDAAAAATLTYQSTDTVV